ncbi:MAG TPA: phosphodiester glycosidase family protein [Solirubrobacterales bacterium]|nr:phosphodiester glycosidase family protein [Solirubrobacterales bacterium]
MLLHPVISSLPALTSNPLFESVGLTLADGARTTLRVARFDRTRFGVRAVAIEPAATLLAWCAENGVEHAMIGGFYMRPGGPPLGDLQIDGRALPTEPFDPPWGSERGCVHAIDGEVTLAARRELPARPRGDLLQAGPMLVAAGRSLIHRVKDLEGFSAGSRQFDSDITVGRYPRAALGLGDGETIAAVSEGRADDEAGLTLAELATAMIGLGATRAINLDGGGSASLVVGGRLRNTPREEHGEELVGGRAIATALRFVPR